MDAIERRKRASAEASDWFVRLQAEDLPRSSREEYIDWLRDSPTNVAEMLRIAQVHGSLEQFQRWANISTDGRGDDAKVVPLAPLMGQERADEDSSGERPRRGNLKPFALAAAVAAVSIATSVLLPALRGQVIDTERGERREVVLSDGSVVQVDPQTHLRVRFKANARRVYLERGRALFHVAKNPDRPFLVQADDTTVRAVGTAFGVERKREGIIVTVSEGKVAVLGLELRRAATIPLPATGEGKSGGILPSAGGKEGSVQQNGEVTVKQEGEVLLTAGQQLTVQRSGSAVAVRKVDTTRELAWADGQLIFENDRVAQVIEEFNRYNRVQLHVTDAALANRPVSGVFSASDPESFIGFIQTVAPVQIVRRGDEDVTISPGYAQ